MLFVSVPALFWYGTWFGTRLGDAELLELLGEQARPRDVQHALAEYTRRVMENRPGTDRFAEPVLAASQRSEESVRIACAWAMQYDPGRPGYVERLREMVAGDPSPLVRRNAATSLAVSGDAAGLPVLRAMLRPHAVTAPEPGRVADLLAVGRSVREHQPVATLERAEESPLDVRTPLPGRVLSHGPAVGATVEACAELLLLAPSDDHLLNAAVALARVGEWEDLEPLRLAASPRSGHAERVRAAAAEAARRIERRLSR